MGPAGDFSHIPIIDVCELVADRAGRLDVARRLGEACRESGFFYAVGHGVDEGLQRRLRELSRQFFAQDVDTKMQLRMALGGRAGAPVERARGRVALAALCVAQALISAGFLGYVHSHPQYLGEYGTPYAAQTR